MSDWPVGLSTGCFYQQNILECLEPIMAGGFSLIEVCSSRQHLDYHDEALVKTVARKLTSLSIGAWSFHAPFEDRIDITDPDEKRCETSVQEVLVAAEAAAALGTRHFVIHPGPEKAASPSSDERLARLEVVSRSLSRIALRCRELGLSLALENKLPHLLFGNTADMLWILGAMTAPGVGVCLDTGHARLAGELGTAVRKFAGHLRMVHASDNLGSRDDHLPPGRGNIDWPAVLLSLRKAHFEGTLILEIASCGDIAETLEAARQSRQFLRQGACKLAAT